MAADFDDLRTAIRERAMDMMRTASERVRTETSAAAPVGEVDGGTLRDSHTVTDPVQAGDTIQCELVAEAPHAAFVAEGTQPHIIRPVRAKALRFEVGGDVVYAAIVHHPGTPAQPDWWSEDAIGRRFRDALEAEAS